MRHSHSEVRTTDMSWPQRQVCHPLRDTSDVCSFHNRSRMPPNPEPIVMISGEGDEWQPADMIGVALFRAVRSSRPLTAIDRKGMISPFTLYARPHHHRVAR